MKTKIILYTISFLILVSCVSYEEETKKAMNSWLGSHKSTLIQQWGAPTRYESDGKGGEILIYEERPADRMGNYRPQNAPRTAVERGVVDGYNRSLNRIYYKEMFVDPNGKIYYWRTGAR